MRIIFLLTTDESRTEKTIRVEGAKQATEIIENSCVIARE